MHDLRAIARALGGEVAGHQVLAPGPGHGPRDRSLSVKLSATSPDGFVAFSHAGDDWRACRDHVRSRLGICHGAVTHSPLRITPAGGWKDDRRVSPPPRPLAVPGADNAAARTGAALDVWREGVDPRRTLAERYLNSRKLELGDDIASEVLRWHPHIGAMLALFRNIETDAPQAVSRTFLDREGRKIERKFLGPVAGASVMLDPDENVLGGLHVGEGVETCMAARQLGLRPTWALGSAGAIAAFPVLSGIEALSILAEDDEANARASKQCGDRWRVAGREVRIIRPIGGKDLNDAARGQP